MMFVAALVRYWRSVVALALAIALTCVPPLNVVAHNTAVQAALEAERHATLGLVELVDHDHGHSHDDADPDERVPGHAHGHDPSDHSHDTGQYALAAPGLAMYPQIRLIPLPAVRQNGGLRDRLERPPRALS
jgi:hypothetical protein